MSRAKTILAGAGIAIACFAGGVWAGKRHESQIREENFTLSEFLEVEHHVKTLGFLYDNQTDKAVHELERRLNVEILVLGPNPYHPRPLNDNQIAALRMASAHRLKHPFQEKSPGVNQMIQTALKSVQ